MAYLGSPNRSICLFRHYAVYVEVKAEQILADENESALARGADIDLRRRALVEPPDVAHRHCRHPALAFEQHSLKSREHFTWTVIWVTVSGAVDERFCEREELKARQRRELRDLINAGSS